MRHPTFYLILLIGGFVLLSLFIGITLYVSKVKLKEKEMKEVYKTNEQVPLITCIMITGKDSCREQFAKQSINNFLEQTYVNKQLVIINHGTFTLIHDQGIAAEFKVDKNGITLGELRNIALQLVPLNGLWCVWDDDDYRSPDFLAIMYNHMRIHKADVVAIKNRMEFNGNTSLIWKMSVATGCVHVLAKQDARIKYLHTDTMEDVTLFNQYKQLGYKVSIMTNNDPLMYIRIVHTDNTSLYVDAHKTAPIINNDIHASYRESRATEQESQVVSKIISSYYKGLYKCRQHTYVK